MVNFFSYITS